MVLSWKTKVLIGIIEGLGGRERFITAVDEWQKAGKELPFDGSCAWAHPGARGSFDMFKERYNHSKGTGMLSPGPGTWDETSIQEEGDTSEEEIRYHHNKKILGTPCLSSSL